MWKLIDQVEKLMQKFPYGCQSEKSSGQVFISVKLFDLWSSINWWLSEYDPKDKVAFWYVTGFYEDEWGSVSLEELESLDVPISIQNVGEFGSIPRIELDKFFKPTKFKNLPFN